MNTRPVDPANTAQPPDPLSTDVVRAAIFDMDGVVTDTAGVHAGAWRQMFDQVLRVLSGSAGAVMAFDPVVPAGRKTYRSADPAYGPWAGEPRPTGSRSAPQAAVRPFTPGGLAPAPERLCRVL